MITITVSAPGKLMLLGEHSVVYGHPCIVTAVDQRLYVSISKIPSSKTQDLTLRIDAPDVDLVGYEKPFDRLGDGDIPKGARFIEFAVKNFFEEKNEILKQAMLAGRQVQNDNIGLAISTKSDFKSTFGFGSSSASTVCSIKALSELFNLHLSNKEIFDLSYKTILDIQGVGSGFDIAVAIYGGTIYFSGGDKAIFPLAISTLPLLIGYSGIKADTVTLIKHVAKLGIQKPDVVEDIFLEIDELVEKGKLALEQNDFATFGKIMNKNQLLLEKLGVSIEKLDTMIAAARNAGAYGAKLSGAGGGDCMISLSAESKVQSVKSAIVKTGGEIIDVSTNAEGVRVEK